MQTLWFVLVALMVTAYVVLDGFDLGAGVIHLFAARTTDERRAVIRAIGPVWDGNEVWLIAAGGSLFFSFPLLYASSFSGFYLPLTIVLWLLIVRGLSVELRSHIRNPIWMTFWDGLFFVGSTLLSIFFGAALANVVRGVPLDKTGYFFEPLWTNFSPKGPRPGILDWYTVLIGLLALAVLITHGANYIAVKTEGDLNRRSRRISFMSWIATVALTALGTAATFWLRPHLIDRFNDHVWGYVFPVVALAGLVAAGYFNRRGRDLPALLASGVFIVGMMTSTAFALYPRVLPAVDSTFDLTIHNAGAPHYGLVVGLVWWSIGMVLAAVYFVTIYRMFRGKVSLEGEGY